MVSVVYAKCCGTLVMLSVIVLSIVKLIYLASTRHFSSNEIFFSDNAVYV
jgi:hypothetical protein